MSYEYGEGVLMIDAATDRLILEARKIQKDCGLTDAGIRLALYRAYHAESGPSDKPSNANTLGTLSSSVVLTHDPEK